jgi:hypothetical protein
VGWSTTAERAVSACACLGRQATSNPVKPRAAVLRGGCEFATVSCEARPKGQEGSVSDTLLRELERRWRETRSQDDEARYLRAMLRAGELSAARLVLAVHLGSAAAAQALGEDAPLVPADHDEWLEVVWAVSGDCPGARLRAALAAARLAFSSWVRSSDPEAYGAAGEAPGTADVRELFESILAWLEQPDGERAVAVSVARAAVDATVRDGLGVTIDGIDGSDLPRHAKLRARVAARDAYDDLQVCLAVSELVGAGPEAAEDYLRHVVAATSAAEVRGAVGMELSAWALGREGSG